RLQPHEAAISPGQGEIAVKGPQVMRGYHRLPEETQRVVDADGFLHTGDLGEWTEQGLRIAGRVDGVFKLENGEKVSAAVVDARIRRIALASSPLSIETGELTPTLKIVRAAAWKANAPLVEALRSGAPHPLIVEVAHSPDDVASA